MLGYGDNLNALTASLDCEVSGALTASISSDMKSVISDSSYSKN